MNILQQLSVNNDCYKANVNKQDSRYTTFQRRGPLGAVLHSIGCPQPSANVLANGWNVPNKPVAVHAVLQADGTVYQCLPWNFRGWHAGGEANNTHIGVEMTEPDCIRYTGGSSFTCSDPARAREQVRGTYRTAVELFAMLAKQYGWNPETDIMSHAEAHARGLGSNHGDPEHLWRGLGLPYTMDTFRADVAKKMTETEETEMRYHTLADLKKDASAEKYYLPTMEKLMGKGILNGKGGEGAQTVIDLGEDAVRVLVALDRAGVFGE